MGNPRNYDRTTQNESDGQRFYGYDNEDGTTDWSTDDGSLDSRNNTPSEDDDWW